MNADDFLTYGAPCMLVRQTNVNFIGSLDSGVVALSGGFDVSVGDELQIGAACWVIDHVARESNEVQKLSVKKKPVTR